MIFLSLQDKEQNRHSQREKLGGGDGEPDAVQPEDRGEHQHDDHLKHERAQEGDHGGNHAVIQSCEER